MKTVILLFILPILAITSYKTTKKAVLNSSNTFLISQKKIVIDTQLQYFKGDTVRYIKEQILDKKRCYLGKNLVMLLRDLELNIKSYNLGHVHSNKYITTSLTLWFYNKQQSTTMVSLHKKPANIIIIWETPLPSSKDNELLMRTQGNWTQEAKDYYSWPIVKDILTTEYK